MPDHLHDWFSTSGFLPHGHCYLWRQDLVLLHVVSDAIVGTSYFAIPFLLWSFVRRRRDLPFQWMFVCFAIFIAACGTSHLLEIWTLWFPDYWLLGGVKAVTALFSLPTAVLLGRLLPKAVALPSPTDLRVTLSQAQASESAYRALLEASGDAFFVLVPGRDGLVVRDVNTAAERLARRERGDLLERAVVALGDTPLPALVERASEVMTTGRGTEEEVRWAPLGQAPRWLQVQVGPMLGGVAVMLRDVTARVDATNALRDREEQLRTLMGTLEERVRARTHSLETANRELEAFSYTVSHDLRGPLRAIDAWTSTAASEPGLGETGQAALARVRAAARRMNLLIDDLLRLARVARTEVRPVAVNLTALAEAIVADLRQANPERTVEVSVEAGLSARADPALLRVALENLLGNAWKYTGPRERAEIRVRALAPGVFAVADNGVGFDMRYAAKLFRPFERLHGVHEFEGSGVGLAIVQRVIARHGGEICAEATLDGGATFYFTLPGDERRPELAAFLSTRPTA